MLNTSVKDLLASLKLQISFWVLLVRCTLLDSPDDRGD